MSFYFFHGLLSALLIVISFPPYSAWGLIFIGLVPFLLAFRKVSTLRQALFLGIACSVPMALMGYHWISYVAVQFGGLPWIAAQGVLLSFSLIGEIQVLLFAIVLFYFQKALRKKSHATRHMTLLWVLGLPVLYVAVDFLTPKIFPSTLGHSLHRWLSLSQIAEFTGVPGLTFLILCTNTALAFLISEVSFLKRFYTTEPWGALARPTTKAACTVLAFCLLALSAGHFWGRQRIAQLEAIEKAQKRSFKFSVIQANIGDLEKLASEGGYGPAIRKVLGLYRLMSLEAVQTTAPDVVIWPETAYPLLYTHFQDQNANRRGHARDEWIEGLLQEIKTPLLFGGYSSQRGKDFNSAFLVEPKGVLGGIYLKSILMPFGEYVPLGPLAPLVHTLIPTIADFERGKGPMNLLLKNKKGQTIKLSPQICYEGLVPEHSRESTRIGGEVLVNVTNDSWFGPVGEPWLHLLLTTFRTIENRRPMIRATNTGISTLIAATGEVRYATRLFEPTNLNLELSIPETESEQPITFYTKYGEVFAQTCVIAALLIFLFLLGGSGFTKKKR